MAPPSMCRSKAMWPARTGRLGCGAGFGTGVGRALERLAQYYISLAEKVFPVIEVDAGRTVDVVITQGVSLQGSLDAAAQDREEFPQLAERTQNLRRNDDDDQ